METCDDVGGGGLPKEELRLEEKPVLTCLAVR